ncbi:MAG TPA: hypothetical protein VLG25_03335 [Patescibacteria group bacterium]|nr:hypothetical protein [Patescibacteria group bacterium]
MGLGKRLDDGRLLRAMAEQLKAPILQIARQLEFEGQQNESLAELSEQAEVALNLLDSYLLSTELHLAKEPLELEPVAISSMLYDTAHNLSNIAGQYNCQVELQLSGKYEPVLAHKKSLGAALTTLGYSFIEAQNIENLADKTVITLAAHRTRYGIIAGIYGEQEGLSKDIYRRAKKLYGRAHQSLSISPSTGAGVFLADALLASMSSHLHVSHHKNLSGLAATLLSSSQMSLV